MKTIVLGTFLLMGSCVFAQERATTAKQGTSQPIQETPVEMPVSDSVTVHSTSRTAQPKTIARPAASVETAEPKAISPARKPE